MKKILLSTISVFMFLSAIDTTAQNKVAIFDGSADNSQITFENGIGISPEAISTFTVEMWIKPIEKAPAEPVPYQTLIVAGNLSLGWGTFRMEFLDDEHWQVGTDARNAPNDVINSDLDYVEYEAWQHVAFVFDHGVHILYRNAREIARNDSPENMVEITWDGSWKLNHYLNYATFLGKMDEVRIWSTARTGDDIRNHASIFDTITSDDLVHYYNFESENANDVMATGDDGLVLSGVTFGEDSIVIPGDMLLPDFVSNPETSNLEIFPNPVKNNLSINLENNDQGNLEIISLSGTSVKKIKIEEDHSIINVSDLSRGMYLIKFESAKGTLINKFIKE